MRARFRLLLLSVLLGALGGCAPTVDLSKSLQVLDVSTGWADLGVVNGQNKLVPWVSFKLKNLSDQSLVALKINAVFRRVGSPDEWGGGFIVVAKSEGLAPGATTKAFTIQSSLGYTGLEPRLDMLKHAQFVDAKVELAARYASIQWVRTADFQIERRLLAP